MSKILYISPSMLARSGCDTRMLLASLKLTSLEPKPAPTVGALLHKAFASYLLGESVSFATANLIAEYKVLEAEGALTVEPEVDPEYGLDNLTRLVEAWCERNTRDKLHAAVGTVDAVEEAYEVTLGRIYLIGKTWLPYPTHVGTGSEVRLFGVLDARSTKDGLTYVLEHKTTRRNLDANFKREFQVDPQTGASLYAAGLKWGKVAGVYVNALHVGKLPDSDNKCRGSRDMPSHGVPYSECGKLHLRSEWFPVEHTDARMAAWRREALLSACQFATMLDIASQPLTRNSLDKLGVHQQGLFNHGMCVSCDYFGFCMGGRPMDEVANMLMVAPDKKVRHSGWETEAL